MQSVVLTLDLAQMSAALDLLTAMDNDIQHAINSQHSLSVWTEERPAGSFMTWCSAFCTSIKA